jgi:hypothetical protein
MMLSLLENSLKERKEKQEYTVLGCTTTAWMIKNVQ